jgi:alkylation response protein AidB-like acyl-CoA dehydrogenase
MLSPFPTPDMDILKRAEDLAQNVFMSRAEKFDERCEFPAENFDDLFSQGLMAAPIEKQWGGLEYAPAYGDVRSLWHMTSAIAKADLSFARCWEGHNNAMLLLDTLASDEQKKRWFTQVTQQRARWAAWSGEPQSVIPGQKRKVGTTVEHQDGGYLINGNKVFATSAPGANWAILPGLKRVFRTLTQHSG